MPPLTFQRPVNIRRLLDELKAIQGTQVPGEATLPDGTHPLRSLLSVTTNQQDGTVTLYPDESLPQSVIDQINTVVAAHDGTPDPVPPTVDFGTDVPDNVQFLLAQMVQDLRTYLALPATNSAQAINFVPALKNNIRVVLYLLRRQTG